MAPLQNLLVDEQSVEQVKKEVRFTADYSSS